MATSKLLLGAFIFVAAFLVVFFACSAAVGVVAGAIASIFGLPFWPAAIGGALGSSIVAATRMALTKFR